MTRTILVVEDEQAIGEMLRIALSRNGYRVVHAPGSGSAIEVAKAHGSDIAVVLCDVVLPDGPGPEAMARIQLYCPEAPAVFMSGYPFDVLTERGLISADLLRELNALYLPKPFLPEDVRIAIATAVRDVPTMEASAGHAY
jgi:CheY-like chemotaxis protein